jgi:hypothetical protein
VAWVYLGGSTSQCRSPPPASPRSPCRPAAPCGARPQSCTQSPGKGRLQRCVHAATTRHGGNCRHPRCPSFCQKETTVNRDVHLYPAAPAAHTPGLAPGQGRARVEPQAARLLIAEDRRTFAAGHRPRIADTANRGVNAFSQTWLAPAKPKTPSISATNLICCPWWQYFPFFWECNNRRPPQNAHRDTRSTHVHTTQIIQAASATAVPPFSTKKRACPCPPPLPLHTSLGMCSTHSVYTCAGVTCLPDTSCAVNIAL